MPNEFVTREPHPAVRPYVSRYVGYRQDDVTLAVHRGLPSRHVSAAISLADPLRFAEPNARLQAALGGLHTSPVLIEQDRTQCGIQLEINPLGARALVGVSSAELSGVLTDMTEVGPAALTHLPERLYEAKTWSERFAVLDAALLAAVRQVSADHQVAPEIAWTWRRMATGAAVVGELAEEVGWSERHFRERFRAQVGLSPKEAARVLRFERAKEALLRRPTQSLAELAVACGFYDQAHLTNEWRRLAGCTPTTWIAEETPHLRVDAA
ncbi:helix-turn-helix domain-containing protein [Thermocrispum municipale]|uniref:helix-turn-helix domain-containing protein n=1 Tax=Thermocrispum municipale TaxID=37926 RepID=UPI00040B89BE|nr:helix-turn-helix domain-containing protein [Thermocrispum municipale]